MRSTVPPCAPVTFVGADYDPELVHAASSTADSQGRTIRSADAGRDDIVSRFRNIVDYTAPMRTSPASLTSGLLPAVVRFGLLGLAACKLDDAGPPDSGEGESVSGWTDSDGARIDGNSDGTVTFTDANGSQRTLTLALGRVSHPEDTVNYDPYNLKDPDQVDAIPLGLKWVAATAWDPGTRVLTLSDGSVARLAFEPGRVTLVQAADDEWAPYVRVTVPVEPTEGLYGLGEQFQSVEHRGTIKAMQFELWADMESVNNEAHVPVPLLVSSEGWGLLADSFRPGVFDVASTDPAVVEVTYNLPPNDTGNAGFSFDLYGPGTGALVVARYHERTGMPEVPPTWAFAPLQWRNAVDGAQDVRDDMAAIRENGIPTGLIWLDNPWQTTYNSMVPDPAQFPEWDQLVADLHAQGFRTMAWSTPYLEEEDPERDAYEASGWFVDAPILINPFGDWVDLSLDGAMAAWQARVSDAADLGIEGWKLDYGEDGQVGLGSARLQSHFGNGEDERTMHHKYAVYYDRAYSEPYPIVSGDTDPDGLPQMDGTRAGFILGRAGVLGGHTVADCIWPGDLDNDLSHFTRGTGSGDGPVGGLSSAIRGGTSLAASGYPFFASDTGGYRGGRPSKETMIRWTEYSATLPIMQYGGAGENHNPWDFTAYEEDETSQFDQETLDIFRVYAVLHTRLFPTFWALAQRARTEGLPIVQALGLAYPELGLHPQNEFLVGDDILVAPIEDIGATARSVDFPPGGWVHWWTGETVTGPASATVNAPLGAGPLYQRAGSAIPMLRRSVMTLSPSIGEGGPAVGEVGWVDSWADDPGVLNARVIVDETGAGFELTTGEALSADPVEDGADRVIHLTAGTLYVGWDIEVFGAATAVRVDGVELPRGEDGCAECWFPEPMESGDGWTRIVTDGEEVVVAG